MPKNIIVPNKGKWCLAGTDTPYTGLGHSRGVTYQYQDGVRTVLSKLSPNIQEYVNNLWEMENPQRRGLRNGIYYPFSTGISIDFGAGIDLDKQTPEFRKAAYQGFSEKQMNDELSKRAEVDLKYVDKTLRKYTQFPDTVSPSIKMGLMDMKHQVGSLGSYNKLLTAVANGNLQDIQEESKVSYRTEKSGDMKYDRRRHDLRNEKYFNYSKPLVSTSLPKYITPAKPKETFPTPNWNSFQWKPLGIGEIIGVSK